MSESTLRYTLRTGAAVLGALMLIAAGRPPGSVTDLVGVGSLETWEAQAGRSTETVEGLVLVRWVPEQEATLVLLQLPGQRRLLLTRRWWVKEGVSELKLTDDGSGWWARLTEWSTFRLDSIDQIGQPAVIARKWTAEEHRVAVKIEASSLPSRGFDWESSLDDAGLYPDVLAQMDADGLAAPLARGMPAATQEAVRTLGSLLSGEHEDGSLGRFERFVRVLAAAVERHGEDRAAPFLTAGWKLATRSGQSLKEPLGEAWLGFAARFRGVPAGDPLALVRAPAEAPLR